MSYVEAIDNHIALYLHHSGKTKSELANSLGITPETLLSKREGRQEFKLSEFVKLADIIGVEPAELLIF